MNNYSWEITSYENQTGESFSISLNPIQMQAINTFLGMQTTKNKKGEYEWTSFSDESLIKLINDFNKRYKWQGE